MEDAEPVCAITLEKLPAQATEFLRCGIADYLGEDEITQVFHVLFHTDWQSALRVCKSWNKIGTRCFKEKILPILSHRWTGWSKWTTRFLKPIDWDVQSISTEMKFGRDKKISGEGKNHGFSSTWSVCGTYDLDSNSVEWEKEFVDGQWKGRTIKYSGKLVFEVGSVSIEGVTVLEKKESPENPWDRIGDTGAFRLTSLVNPDDFLECI
jgi:hypothetical protein